MYLDASGEMFSLSYQGINGNWSVLQAGATWMFSKQFGIGLGTGLLPATGRGNVQGNGHAAV